MSTRFMRALTRGLLAAMLLAVLAPAVSRALASTRGAGDWVEICSAQGMQWVQLSAAVDGAQSGVAKDPALVLDECGHCLLSADRFAPLIPSLLVFGAAISTWPTPPYRGLPALAASAPSPGARGPPLF